MFYTVIKGCKRQYFSFEPCRLDQIDKFLLNLVDFSFYLIKTLYVQFLPFKKASKKEGRHAT